jgi:alpha-galactosidase/6-phospho-beta-glucosidase family protein
LSRFRGVDFGSRKLMTEALVLDGSVPDYSTAQRLAEELLQAHRTYLPQFK